MFVGLVGELTEVPVLLRKVETCADVFCSLLGTQAMLVKQEQEKMVCVSHAPKVNIEVVAWLTMCRSARFVALDDTKTKQVKHRAFPVYLVSTTMRKTKQSASNVRKTSSPTARNKPYV